MSTPHGRGTYGRGTALVAATGSLYAVAGFVAVIALISLTCSYLMTETLRSDLGRRRRAGLR